MSNGIVTNYDDGKQSIVVKTITTFADVGAGNVAIMYGTSVALHRQSEIRLRLLEILETIIEAGFTKPATPTNYISATVAIDSPKSAAAITEETSIAIPAETDVAIVYSDTFDNTPASTLNLAATVNHLIDKLIDDVLSAA